ncbi:MAG: glycosyltransferase [Planctomycetota bacterium]
MPGRALFILGMHRSGTSLAAGLARLAGVDLGRNLMVGEEIENPRGFWEHRDVLAIDERLLTALSLAWHVPTPLPADWLMHPRLGLLAEQATETLARDFSDSPLWGIKDPRLCRLWPFWERAAAAIGAESRFLHVFRHPLEVADSLAIRNQMPAEQALLLWLYHNLEAVRPLLGDRLLVTPLRRLIQDGLGFVTELRAWLGEDAPLAADARRAIDAFVAADLLHHQAKADDPRLETPAGRLAARCHACLERLAAGDAAVGDELTIIAAGLEELVTARRNSRRRTAPVDVVVPVHRGREATFACIDSVLAGGGDFELVVIDDATPEPELAAALRHRAGRGEFTLLEHESNLGFVAAANRGMRLHPDRDVVLLNADTVVPPGWLERLRAAADGDFVGTVTPFSNNATLASYPVPFTDNELPSGWTAAALDALFREANAGWIVDIPTAVGFCMYLRRDCLEDVGFFDELLFGRGYGEENDFSLRAVARGWRNVLAADVFVLHHGRVSFLAETEALQRRAGEVLRRKYPAYDTTIARFRHDDLLAAARDVIAAARVACRGPAELHRVFVELRRSDAGRIAAADALRLELARLDAALGEAQRIVRERETEAGRLTTALADAQRLAHERLDHNDRLDAALAEARRLADERLEHIATLDNALGEATRVAHERLVHNDRLDAALAEARRLAEERLTDITRLSHAQSAAESLATARLAEIEALDGQLRAATAAHGEAERLAIERLSALEALDRQLHATAAALAATEDLARARLSRIEELTRQLEAFPGRLPPAAEDRFG